VTDLFLFALFPYVAVALAIAGVIYRRRALRFTMSTSSSQLLEGRWLFWGSVPWHVGILLILGAHAGATLLPATWARLLGEPLRLYVLEATGLALGALTVLGVVTLVARRCALRAATSAMDWVLLLALALQAMTGVYIAFTLRWGGAWYVHTASPWLASLAALSPRIDGMAMLPGVVKLHAVNAFVLVALMPVSKLIHLTVIPIAYLWRAPQVVVWRRAVKEEAP
jgi:nitrate reductase gamma subunit